MSRTEILSWLVLAAMVVIGVALMVVAVQGADPRAVVLAGQIEVRPDGFVLVVDNGPHRRGPRLALVGTAAVQRVLEEAGCLAAPVEIRGRLLSEGNHPVLLVDAVHLRESIP